MTDPPVAGPPVAGPPPASDESVLLLPVAAALAGLAPQPAPAGGPPPLADPAPDPGPAAVRSPLDPVADPAPVADPVPLGRRERRRLEAEAETALAEEQRLRAAAAAVRREAAAAQAEEAARQAAEFEQQRADAERLVMARAAAAAPRPEPRTRRLGLTRAPQAAGTVSAPPTPSRATSPWMVRSLAAAAAVVVVAGAAVTGLRAAHDHHAGRVTLRSSAGLIVAPSSARHQASAATPGRVGQPAAGLPRPSANLPTVASLDTVRSAEAIVTLPSTISPDEVQSLLHLSGLSAVEEVDVGTVKLAGAPAVTIGVDPGTFRQFTPKVTATQDQLWRYVAAGSLVSSYDMAADRQLALGKELSVDPAGGKLAPTTGWLGGLASFGLPGIDMVVSHNYSTRLGLVPDSGLIVSAPGMDPYALEASLVSSLPGANVELVHPNTATGSSDSPALPQTTLTGFVNAALSRVGDPYVWGGTGPSDFDCSGLVQWALSQVGVSVPRTSEEQYTIGPQLTLSQAQRGDLLFFAYDPDDPSDIDHVAIYLGNGMEVEAPHTGENVQVVPVPTSNLVGAVRIDPGARSAAGTSNSSTSQAADQG